MDSEETRNTLHVNTKGNMFVYSILIYKRGSYRDTIELVYHESLDYIPRLNCESAMVEIYKKL
jgi:hypothetical protein